MIQFKAAEGRVVRTAPDKVTDKVTDAEKALLELLIENPALTYAALAGKLGISRKSVSSRIKSLKEKGIIRRIGSDTKGSWEIIQ